MINDTEHENHSHDFNNKSQKKVHTHTHINIHTLIYTYIHAFEPQLLCSDQPCKFRTDMSMICLCVLCVPSLNHV